MYNQSLQICDGKTSESDAIILDKFLNKLFCRYTAILPVDGATKVGGGFAWEQQFSYRKKKKKKFKPALKIQKRI